MTMDKMILHGLRCTAHIGCKPEERALPQALLVDVTIELDTTPAAQADDLGLTVNYAHLSKANVRPGQKVKRGEVIGQMGSSGLASGTHLHYEVVKNGQKVNPVHFFYGDLTPAEYEQILEDASVVNKALS